MVEEVEGKEDTEQEILKEVQQGTLPTVKDSVDENIKSNTQIEGPRAIDKETLITTAVHFLQNSKVRNVPLSQKRAFLLRKGLSNDDIDKAIERVTGETKLPQINNKQTTNGYSNSLVPYQPAGPVVVYQPPSLWHRWREFCSSLMVIGATFYGCYFVFKRYMEPLIIGKRKQEEDRMAKIERHLMELNKSLTSLRHSLVSVESKLCKQNKSSTIDDQLSFGSDSTIQAQDYNSILDIKGDIATIKSLLLSRNQFPAAPTSSLSIPTWQLKEREAAADAAMIENQIEEETLEDIENEEISDGIKTSKEEFEKLPNGIAINGNISDH